MRRHDSQRYGKGELAKVVGGKIRALRRSHRWSRAFLASQLEISIHWLENYETGAALPPTYTLYQLAGLFQVSSAVFLDDVTPRAVVAHEFLEVAFRFAATLPAEDQEQLGKFFGGIVAGIGKMRGWIA